MNKLCHQKKISFYFLISFLLIIFSFTLHSCSSVAKNTAQPIAPENTATSSQPQTNSPEIVISTDKINYSQGEKIIVHVVISNPTNETIKILSWFTPINGVERSLFSVQSDSQEIPYLGPMVKRSAPTEQDYLPLDPGKNLSADIELTSFYDMSSIGKYEIKYKTSSTQLFIFEGDAVQNSLTSLESNSLIINVE